MSALSIQPTYPIFTETDGLPLENGYIWIGAANLDPQGNPISVYWDAALTIPAAQPIRTLNGYPSRNGTPARMYVNSDYSIRVQNSKGSLVYSAPAATERYSNVVTNIDLFTSASFGVIGNGVADDTLAMLEAWEYCRTNNKTLLISGRIRIVAATVPSGDFHNTFYVYASSMLAINEAELLVDGKIGFDLTGIDQTLIQGFSVTTTGRQMTESEQNNASPTLFYTGSGSKTSAVYRDLIVYNTVTNLTGAYRAGGTFREYGCESVTFDNIKASNTIGVITISSSTNIVVRNVFGYNLETNIYLSTATGYQVTNCHHINTQTQADFWIGRLATPVRQINGMDNLLVENGDRGTVIGLHTEYAIERACYIQSSNVQLADCYTRNSDAYKLVGNSYTSQVKNHYIGNCHAIIDDDWVASRGRNNVVFLTSYWASEVHVQGCSHTNTLPARTAVQSFINFGRADGSTSENLYVKDCQAVNSTRFIYGFLTPLTTAQLAALSPAGSFISARNIVIEDCYIKKADFRTQGSLYDHRSVEASADALLNYASENIELRNNVVDLPATGAVRDDWLFDVRWTSGATTSNNSVDLPFTNNGFFISAITQPYQNIRMNETGLKHSANPGAIVTRLGNLSLLQDSVLKFSYSSGPQQQNVTVQNYTTGALSGGLITVDLFGKGYAQYVGAGDYAMAMQAKGDFYFGKAVSGAKTDQVSTPPVTITVGAGTIDVRGDLQPTVLWSLTLTKV
jgi:hypothetical protein